MQYVLKNRLRGMDADAAAHGLLDRDWRTYLVVDLPRAIGAYGPEPNL